MATNDDQGDDWDHHTSIAEEDDGGYTAQDLRQMANSYFAQKDYDNALPLYSMALDALYAEAEQSGNQDIDTMITFLCNRSACLFKMEMYDDAKVDAAQAIEISEDINAKAYFRLAKTQIALHEYSDAIKTLTDAIQELDTSTTTCPDTVNQKAELQKLLEVARTYHLRKKEFPNATSLAKVQCIRTEPRCPSIREFEIEKELGHGNFSRVVACRHTITGERFALKMIEKKKAEQLAKRQHPNVYNEIEMERKVLSIRLNKATSCSSDGAKSSHVEPEEETCQRIIRMYHSFQDYNHLYFLMDLHLDGGDMWSRLRHKGFMVGLHQSLVKVYLYELLEALEFMHSRGIVHRDLKAENMLLSSTGHLILIDFGTAKDLIHTESNGPEFVGTPDFMAPEAVKGKSDMKDIVEERRIGGGCTHMLDLWALGAVAYQLLTGITPFWSPSPYLTFLRIQRGQPCRNMGIADDDAWDLIQQLIKVEPSERLGSNDFEYIPSKGEGEHQMIGKSYASIRRHDYFAKYDPISEDSQPIPALRDLCIQACAALVQRDSLDLDIDKRHPPGDGSSHDMLRLNNADRRKVMDLLDKIRVLSEPRVYRRFFKTKQEARLNKVRNDTRDYTGLTQMNDKQHQFPTSESEGVDIKVSDVTATMDPINYIHITNPLFVKETNENCGDERKQCISELKGTLRSVNKARPKLVVASGYIDAECRKLLGKVSETIPVILNDGNSFFSFWSSGGQGLVLRSRDFVQTTSSSDLGEQLRWLNQELEQSRMTKHHIYAFVDCDPDKLPDWLLRKLAKGHVLCLFGVAKCNLSESAYEHPPKDIQQEHDSEEIVHEDASVSSSDSEDAKDKDTHIMKIVKRDAPDMCSITLEEYGDWKMDFIKT